MAVTAPTTRTISRSGAWRRTCDDARVDDRSLVQAVTSGDRDAFRVLVDRESVPVFRACYRILGRVHDAEDVAQESFVIAYRSIGSFRGEGALGGWVMRIAVREALRRLGRRRDASPLEPSDESTMTGSTGRPHDPLGLVLLAERQETVRRAVEHLGEPYREVVALRFFGELSLEEIARATGRPVATIKTHLRRGLQRLRQSLGEEVAA